MLKNISKIIPSCLKIVRHNPPNLNINDLPVEIIIKIFEEIDSFYQEHQLTSICHLFNNCLRSTFNKNFPQEQVKCLAIFKHSLIKHNNDLSIKLFKNPLMKNRVNEIEMLKLLVNQGELIVLKKLIDEELVDNKVWNKQICYEALKKAAGSGQLEISKYLLEKYFLEFQETWTDAEGEIFFEIIQKKQNEIAKLFFENKNVVPLANKGASFLEICRRGNLELLVMFLQAAKIDLSPYLDTALLTAVWHNHSQVLIELLKHEYFKNQPIKPWILDQAHKRAAFRNHFSIVKYLPSFKEGC